MKATIHLLGHAEDFRPKFDKMSPDDLAWLEAKIGKKRKPDVVSMDLEEVTKLLTMFNNVEKIYFEVR